MKNIYAFILGLAVISTACDPNEDIYNELDEAKNAQDNSPTATFALTLDKANYTSSGNDEAAEMEAFGSLDQAFELIPVILNTEYPLLGKGSLATVTFDVFDKSLSLDYSPTFTKSNFYEVTTEDYDALGGNVATYDNFSSQGDIINFLNYKFPGIETDSAINLRYDYFSGGQKNTLTNKIIFTNGGYEFPYNLVKADYTALGQNFTNFDDKELAQELIGRYLTNQNPYEIDGDEKSILYTYTYVDSGRKFEDIVLYYEMVDGKYMLKNPTTTYTRQFKNLGTTWETDNTITYTLTPADYTLVGNGQYNNFDLRAGRAEEKLEVRIEKINTILKKNFPSAKVGQKYLVTYAYYDGSNGTEDLYLILDASGDYIVFEEN